jgi:dTDP-4-dehydrorhamnose reductase
MTVLLTGGSGQLGTELQKLGDMYAPSRAELDITNQRQVLHTINDIEPSLIIHAAAYTNTLGADYDENEMVRCWRTNVLGTRNLVRYADCPIVLISTEAAIHPYSFYILSKLQAEIEVSRHDPGYTIIRTSFRHEPFEYPRAFVDMWTIGDYTPVIAGKLWDLVTERPVHRDVVWLGTGAKTVFQLAVRSRPEAKPVMRAEVNPHLPSLEELVDVPCVY